MGRPVLLAAGTPPGVPEESAVDTWVGQQARQQIKINQRMAQVRSRVLPDSLSSTAKPQCGFCGD